MKYEDFTTVVNDITGGNKKYITSDYLEKGKYPIIDQSEKFIGGYSNEEEIVKREKDVVVFGDHTKTLKYVDFDFCLGADGVKVLQPIKTLESKFLYYFLHTQELPNVGYSRHYKFLKEKKIPLPSLAAQKAIAEKLDKADALRKKDQELLAHYDELAQSIFIDMFGDPVQNEMGWEKLKLENVCNKITDGEHTTPKRELEGVYLLSARNVKNGFIDLNVGVDYISEDEYTRISKRCMPENGDVLISCSGSVGRVSIVNVDYKFSLVRSVALLKVKKDVINPLFLNYYMLTNYFKQQIDKGSKKSSQANIFIGAIKELITIIPPLALQTAFAEKIKNIELQKALVKRQAEQSEDLFQALLQESFSF